ncbi:MAG: hypothetical protein JNL74_19165 [Fibrobacteres bacterium]|nr:hypothetical protein [Fibrobacterota bacterium]
MKNKLHVSLSILLLSSFLLTSCTKEDFKGAEYRLPKALYITTGMNYGNGTIAEGILLAIKAFNRHGIPTRLENREIILNESSLSHFDIIIMMTASEYHDADRKHSLVHMTDVEMEILNRWVENGGTLVAGDNLGRFRMNGSDRSEYTHGNLGPVEWRLAKAFGVTLSERNLSGFSIEGILGKGEKEILLTSSENRWSMVPDTSGVKNMQVIADWKKNDTTYPAITNHGYGKGRAILLATSYLLHPSNNGGYSGAADIEQFFDFVAETKMSESKSDIKLSPWPMGKSYAMTITFDAEGDIQNYQQIKNFTLTEGVKAVYFVNPNLDSNVQNAIRLDKPLIASNGFDQINMNDKGFHSSQMNLLMNAQYWNCRFYGYRFPLGIAGFPGLLGLYKEKYLYDISISLDQISEIKGSAVPYNIPITNSGFEAIPHPTSFYCSSDIIEISPILKDDYTFFARLINTDTYPSEEMEKDSRLYQSHLMNTLHQVIKPAAGVVNYFGHLAATGHNDVTLRPLSVLLNTAKRDSAWITPPDSIALWRSRLLKTEFFTSVNSNSIKINVKTDNSTQLSSVALSVDKSFKKFKSNGIDVKFIQREKEYFAVFDAANGTEIVLSRD